MVGGGRAQYLEAYRPRQPSHGRLPTEEKVTADSGSETRLRARDHRTLAQTLGTGSPLAPTREMEFNRCK